MSLKKLFSPRSIAIVGASNTSGKVGNMLAHNVRDHGYDGEIYFVNHKSRTILGQKSFLSLTLIGKKIDVAIIAVPSIYVEDVIREAHTVCKNFVIISAGFGESGIEGHNLEVRLIRLAHEHGLTILGPNCLGFLSPHIHLNASFAPGMPDAGDVALISQSGALAVALIDRAPVYQIGFSAVVSIGNKMQLDAAALITHFAEDRRTRVIALYLEGIKDGPAFITAVRRAQEKGKSIILLKSGRSKAAQDAISLHTGTLAGDDAVINAICVRHGISRVSTIAELLGVIRVARTEHNLSERTTSRVAIVTNAGGPGVIATDTIAATDHLTLARITRRDQDTIQASLPAAASTHNPIDVLGDADTDRYRSALTVLLESDRTDVIMVLLTPQKDTPVLEIAELIIRAHKKKKKDIIVSFIGGERIAAARELLQSAGVLFFDAPDAAITACDLLARRKSASRVSPKIDLERAARLDRIITRAHSAGKRDLYYNEVARIARLYEIPLQRAWDITEGLSRDTAVRYPCVAKVDNPRIQHKSDRGGVILPLASAAALMDARDTLRGRFSEEGSRIIAQPLLPVKMELIIGMKRDATFGPVCVVGIGGIYTEIIRATEIITLPTSLRTITRQLQNSPTLGFLFAGARGQAPYDAAGIAQVTYALAMIAQESELIQAIDINPLLIYNDKTRDTVVDMKVVF